jgi:alpha-L-fucosidase
VPPRADGTFDEPTVNLLRDVGAWLKLNGEAIYATRPWMVFGEGPGVNQSARANRSAYTASNIRFTRSKDGKAIYAILLGWPGAETNVLVKTFARDQPGGAVRVKAVHLLGSALPVVWRQDEAGLHLQTPAQAPSSIAISYRIEPD